MNSLASLKLIAATLFFNPLFYSWSSFSYSEILEFFFMAAASSFGTMYPYLWKTSFLSYSIYFSASANCYLYLWISLSFFDASDIFFFSYSSSMNSFDWNSLDFFCNCFYNPVIVFWSFLALSLYSFSLASNFSYNFFIFFLRV